MQTDSTQHVPGSCSARRDSDDDMPRNQPRLNSHVTRIVGKVDKQTHLPRFTVIRLCVPFAERNELHSIRFRPLRTLSGERKYPTHCNAHLLPGGFVNRTTRAVPCLGFVRSCRSAHPLSAWIHSPTRQELDRTGSFVSVAIVRSG